jgi:transposase-like protein
MGTIVAEVVDVGEKRDGRGRRITAARRREELVRAYHASGMTMAAFARSEGVKYPTFAHWVMKAAKASGPAAPAPAPVPGSAPIRFAELKLPAPPAIPSSSRNAGARDGIEARLPDGTVLRGNNPAELAALIRALRS